MRRWLLLLLLVAAPALLHGQQPDQKPLAFEVASVKPSNPAENAIGQNWTRTQYRAKNAPLFFLISQSFGRSQDDEIAGAPAWLKTDRWDIVAEAPTPGPPFPRLRALLEDRFKLVTHVETREQSMYALVLARSDGKLGEKMTKSTADCTPSGPNGRGRGTGVPPAPGERPKCGFMIGPGRLMVGGQTMAAFATNLSRFVGGIVVDKTGLTGTYDVELTYAPDPGISPTGRDLPPQPGAPPPPAAVGDAPSIFSAVQEQLGLKLDSTKGPVDVLVIDSAEKPRPD